MRFKIFICLALALLLGLLYFEFSTPIHNEQKPLIQIIYQSDVDNDNYEDDLADADHEDIPK